MIKTCCKLINGFFYSPIDMASFHFKKIEFDYECDLDPQLCDSVLIYKSMLALVSIPNLDTFPEPTFIPVPIDFKVELPILVSHVSLMEKECEF